MGATQEYFRFQDTRMSFPFCPSISILKVCQGEYAILLLLLAPLHKNYEFWLLQGDKPYFYNKKKVIPNPLYIFILLMISLAVSNEEWKQIEQFEHYNTAADFLLDFGKPSLFLINR